MALPQSDIEIAQMACDLVGEAPVTDIRPGSTPTETLIARHIDDVRQNLLMEISWNFATTPINLLRVGTPPFDYTDAYALPANYLRLISIGEKADQEAGLYKDYRLADNPDGATEVHISNSASNTLPVLYVADVTDVRKWTAKFRRLMVYFLALQIAYRITKSAEIVERLEKSIARELPQAFSIDGQESPITRIQNSKILERRASLGSTGVASRFVEFD